MAALFAVVWTTAYPDVLAPVSGRLATSGRYTDEFDRRPAEITLPWESEAGKKSWSRFWACYLVQPKRLRELSANSAWERIIPFRWRLPVEIVGAENVEAAVTVLVHPSAISVIIRVEARGRWRLDELASSLADIRSGRHWTMTTAGRVSSDRNLDGIAADLRDDAVPLLTLGAPVEPGPLTTYSIAAPLAGRGDPEAFALENVTASSCLAGLAVLGRPGPLNAKRLLEQNTDPDLGARIYALARGHAIWHPENMLNPPDDDPLRCLLHNHSHLLAQIAGLSAIVTWAGERVESGVQIPVAVQPLIKNAMERLEQLHVGNRQKTYRAGIAKTRIEPLVPTIQAVRNAI